MCMVATSRIDPDLCFIMLQFYLATDMTMLDIYKQYKLSYHVLSMGVYIALYSNVK